MNPPPMILVPRAPTLAMIAAGSAGWQGGILGRAARIWAAMIAAWESATPLSPATSAYLNRPPRSPAEAIAERALALIGRSSRDADARETADRALADIAELRAGGRP